MKNEKLPVSPAGRQLKIKNFFVRFWPILFILTLWFIFAHPYFFKGKVPYASTYQVNFFPPWSHHREFWGPVKNNAMPDVHTQIYPWKKFTIDTYKTGQLPTWNPNNFSGNPHLANYQSAVLSPLNILFFISPFTHAWSMLILLQPLLAGLFMYLFIREIGVGRVGSLISSITFMFCGFIVVWMAYGTLGYAILYLPLALFAIEKHAATKRLRFLLLLSVTVPLSFFSGHFQISLYFLAALSSYIIFKGITTKNILNTFYLIFATSLGLLLATAQLLPSIKLYSLAVRSELFLLSEVIPFQYLITSFAPDFFGNPVTRNDWFGHYAEWASFIGIWPLILAIYATIKIKNQKSKIKNNIIFFAFLGGASLLLAINSPLSKFLVSLKIPVLSTSALSRIIVLFSFSFAALAGFGFDQLRKDIMHKIDFKKIVFLLAAITAVITTIWLLILFANVYPNEWLIVAKRNFILPTILFAAGAFLILATIKQKKLVLFTLFYLLFATSFDSLRFAQKWMPFDPKELVYPSVTIIDAMKKNIGDGRIFGNLGGEVTTYYGLPSIEGYDPLYIGRYGTFIRGASNGEFLEGERSVVRLDRRGKDTDRALDLLGVKLVFHPIADTNQGWAYPVWIDKERYSLAYKDDKFQLFKNNRALPRASLFYDYEVVKNDREIIKRFFSDDFDFRNKLILEEEVSSVDKKGTGSTTIAKYTSNRVIIDVVTDTPALLFLSDNYYPGWKARVNGIESKIYRADYTFRAVVVPAGESTVEFVYEKYF